MEDVPPPHTSWEFEIEVDNGRLAFAQLSLVMFSAIKLHLLSPGLKSAPYSSVESSRLKPPYGTYTVSSRSIWTVIQSISTLYTTMIFFLFL